MHDVEFAEFVASPPRRRRAWLAWIVVALGVAAGLGLTELVTRIAYPLPTRHYVWPPGATLEFHPDLSILHGASPVSRYFMNSWGVRGDEPADGGSYRLLTVGGSAVECVYLDQPRSFPARIGQRMNADPRDLRVWIGNAGKSGLKSNDHVQQLRNLLPDFGRIDAVLVMTGVNDVGAALRAEDPAKALLPVPEAEVLARVYHAYPERWALGPAYRRMGLWQLARRVHLAAEKLFPPNELRADWSGRAIGTWRAHRRSASRIRETLPDLSPFLAEHRKDVEALIGAARERGVRIVLVTQPAIWRADLPPDLADLLWMGGVGNFMGETGHEYYSPGALAGALDAFNRTLLDVARERKVEAFDLAGVLPRDGGVFFDDCHFTEAGSARVADLLADYFLERRPFGAAVP